MTDLVLFAGPVLVTKDHRAIDWYGRDVKIVPISGEGSTFFTNLGHSLADPQGRILPALLDRFARGITPEKIALASYSAGWGLWNLVTKNDDDRARVSALCLSDSAFLGGDPKTGKATSLHEGYVRFGIDAVNGQKLFAATTAHTTPGTFLTGRQSLVTDLRETEKRTGKSIRPADPRAPMPAASGGWWQLGQLLFWGDYTKPGSQPNVGNDYTHEEHHGLSPELWQAYLAPYLAGKLGSSSFWPFLAGLGAGALLARLRH